METWLSYSPEDFLLFSEEVYWRTIELHNARFWPLPLAGFLAGLAIVAMVLRPRPWTGRAILLILAAAWASVAWSWFWVSYASINWAAPVVAVVFAAQAVLLAASALWDRDLTARARGWASIPALALLLYAVALHPLVAVADGRPMSGGETLAAMPTPTAVAALGALALVGRGYVPCLLMLIPALWCSIDWVTLSTLDTWEMSIVGAALVFVPIAVVLENRQNERTDW